MPTKIKESHVQEGPVVIRGALLLTVGFGLGYAKALHDVPAIQDGLITVIGLLKEEAKERVARAEKEKTDNDEQGETP